MREAQDGRYSKTGFRKRSQTSCHKRPGTEDLSPTSYCEHRRTSKWGRHCRDLECELERGTSKMGPVMVNKTNKERDQKVEPRSGTNKRESVRRDP